MDASVVSVVDSRSFEDPSALIGQMAPRKVRRLLDKFTCAPFVTAVRTIEQLTPVDPETVAFYTVSSWDPGVPVPDEPTDVQSDLIDFYIRPANASDWLRRMPHALSCQVAVATGVRGPNLHLVGGPQSLRAILHLAQHALTAYRVEAAVVLAFDDLADGRHVLPDEGAAEAVGLAVRAGDGICAVADLVHELEETIAAGRAPSTALETLRGLTALGAASVSSPPR